MSRKRYFVEKTQFQTGHRKTRNNVRRTLNGVFHFPVTAKQGGIYSPTAKQTLTKHCQSRRSELPRLEFREICRRLLCALRYIAVSTYIRSPQKPDFQTLMHSDAKRSNSWISTASSQFSVTQKFMHGCVLSACRKRGFRLLWRWQQFPLRRHSTASLTGYLV